MIEIQGIKDVVKNLNKEIKGIQNRSMTGLIKSAIHIRNEMDTREPLIPIGPVAKKKNKGHKGTSNLRSSWFTAPFYKGDNPGLMIGFNANYAVYVHEMLKSRKGKPINWSRPGSGPKFLEAALNRNHKRILQIIQENAKIK